MAGESRKTIPVWETFDKMKKNREFMREYDALEEEFARANLFIKARASSGLTQQELADRMKTSQAFIARLESGRQNPSTTTLKRFAEATGHRCVFSFEPLNTH